MRPLLISSLLTISIFLINLSGVYAQFTIGAEIRPRFEARHGYRTLSESESKAAAFFSQRSRLVAEYQRTKLNLKISFQDVRVWGTEPQLANVPSTALHEAWGKVIFSKMHHLKVGRQELIYNDHRLLGSVNWAQQARSHDAMVYQYRNESGWKFDAGGAFNQDGAKLFGTEYSLNNYKVLWFAWLNKVIKEKLDISLLGISDGFQLSDTTNDLSFRYTFGADLNYRNDNFSLGTSIYPQMGKDRTDNDIFALLAAFKMSYTAKKAKLTFGLDFVSGTDATDTTNTKNHSFNTLYATNHKFYGFMDHFLNIPNDTWGGGLMDVYWKLHVKFSKKFNAGSDFHIFALANKVLDTRGDVLGKYLGFEIDLHGGYTISENVSSKLGFSALIPSNSHHFIKGGSTNEINYWAWTMLIFKPSWKSD